MIIFKEADKYLTLFRDTQRSISEILEHSYENQFTYFE